MVVQNEWAQSGTLFTPRSRADKIPILPPGVYEYQSLMGGWGVRHKGPRFTFPFKVYDARMSAIDRVYDFWDQNGGTLGAWYNGIRGGGKTVIVQRLANKFIAEKGVPVLVIRHPVPLDDILGQIRQDVVIIFDEFEKTHEPKEQQHLLSAIDGLSRSEFGRVFLFTTNSRAVDQNFLDRPSRIRYIYEFNRVDDIVIEGLLNDMLPDELSHLRDGCLTYFEGRDVLTIDVVKQTIREVLTFKEDPTEFANFFNVSASNPPTYKVYLVDPETGERRLFESWFKLADSDYQTLVMGKQHAIDNFIRKGRAIDINSNSSWAGQKTVRLLEWNPEKEAFMAQIQIPARDTHWGGLTSAFGSPNYRLWLDPRPEDYKTPPSYMPAKISDKKREKLEGRFWAAMNTGFIHGDHDATNVDDRAATFLVQFETTTEKAPPTKYVAASLDAW